MLGFYEAEGVVAVTREHRALAEAFERCLGCGLCELTFPGQVELRALAGADWRSPDAWLGLAPLLSKLLPADLSDAEATCPGEVPLSALVVELNSALERWRAARGEDAPRPRQESLDGDTIEG